MQLNKEVHKLYINSGYWHQTRLDFKDKKHPLFIGSCGTYRLYTVKRLPTHRPRGRLDYQLLYVASGKAHFYFSGEEKIISAGNMVLYRPKEEQRYYYYAAEQPEIYWVHFTGSDVKKIQEEIDHRKLVVRKEAIEAVKEARAQGDLSENFEYYAAKKDKNRNESRIRYLENMLKHAKIVSEESRPDEVGMNDTVTLYFEDDDEEEVYRLVTSIRGNSLENRISIESPLGKAIEGHHVGDQVEVKVNDKSSYVVEIRKIEKTGEEDSDRIRSY